jgi:transcriptional regulator with XRE-family HTH domain
MTNTAEITLTQGKRIRYARESAGLLQQELADKLRVSRSTLSAWEDDKNRRPVPYNHLLAIATHTGYSVEFFEPREVTFTATATLRYHTRMKVSSLLNVGFRRHPSLAIR